MEKPAQAVSFAVFLKRFRRAADLTQEALAERAGYSTVYLSKLERGERQPLPFTVEALAEALGLAPDERATLARAAQAGAAPPNIRLLPQTGAPEDTAVVLPREQLPLPRNPYFTGRVVVLEALHQQVHAGTPVALTQAISGLGGIGKTQAALEYAYRYRDHYAEVFWLLAETRDTLVSGVRTLSSFLQLPEEQDQQKLLAAFKRWLGGHQNWLLILDNLEDLDLVRDLLPPSHQGAVLLTTRRAVTEPIAQALLLERFPEDEGMLFLLKRAKRLPLDGALEAAAPTEREQARAITRLLGGLPLALDQAGAYILETGCSVAAFLALATERQAVLLQRRGALARDHPASVTTTLLLAVAEVRQQNEAAADLLRWCAYLAPEDIPEELLAQGAAFLDPPLRAAATDPLLLDEAISTLRRYSLLRRDADNKTLSLHRLVQVVLREELDDAQEQQWAERVVRMVSQVVPKGLATNWKQGERYLPHALVCAGHIETWGFTFPEAAALLNQTGRSLYERAAYGQALPLYERALAIREQVLGPDHPDVAESLDYLAQLNAAQGQYAEALPLAERALAIAEQALGPDHPEVARSLNILGQILFYTQGRLSEVLALHQRALAIQERALGPDHLEVAESLHNLTSSYWNQGKNAEALPLWQRTLAIYERQLGPDHPQVAVCLFSLAVTYSDQGRYREAQPLAERARAIWEQRLGPQHPDLAESLYTLARIYREQGQYDEALPLYQQALSIEEQALGPEHPFVARGLHNLALIYREQGRYREALPLAERALSIYQQQLGPNHPHQVVVLNNLATIYSSQGHAGEARPRFEQALSIGEQALGPEHPRVADALSGLAALLEDQGQYEEALSLAERALKIREQVYGVTHATVAESLHSLARIYSAQGRDDKAQRLAKQALTLREQLLGPTHPHVAQSLNTLASLAEAQRRYPEARSLAERALTIREQALGSNHPDVARSLITLARLACAQGQDEEALPLYRRALSILERALPEHPTTITCRAQLAALLRALHRPVEAAALEAQAQPPDAEPSVAGVTRSRRQRRSVRDP